MALLPDRIYGIYMYTCNVKRHYADDRPPRITTKASFIPFILRDFRDFIYGYYIDIECIRNIIILRKMQLRCWQRCKM